MFFNADYMLESFLKQFPDFPNSFLLGGPADIFVIELADQVSLVKSHCNNMLNGFIGLHYIFIHFLQLQKLKVEPVLLHYLTHMRALQGNQQCHCNACHYIHE